MKTPKGLAPSATGGPSQCGMEQHDSSFDNLKTESFDQASLWARVNRDAGLLRELVELFSQQYPGILENLKTAIEQRSFADIQKFSHKLKGSLLQFSAQRAAKVAATLEGMGKGRSAEDAAPMFSKLKTEIETLMEELHSMLYGKKPVV